MSRRQGHRRPLPIPPPPTHPRSLPPDPPEQGELEIFNMEDIINDDEFVSLLKWEPIPSELQYVRPDENLRLPLNPILNSNVGELEDENWFARNPPPEPVITREPLGESLHDYAAEQWRLPAQPVADLFQMLDQCRTPPNLPPPEAELRNFDRQGRQPIGEPRIRLTSAQTYFDELEVFILLNLSPDEGDALRALVENWPMWPLMPPAPEIMYNRFKKGRENEEEFRGYSRLPRSPPSPQGAGRDFSELYQLSPSPPLPQLGAEATCYQEVGQQPLPPSPPSRQRGCVAGRRPLIRRVGAAIRSLVMGRVHAAEAEMLPVPVLEYESEPINESERDLVTLPIAEILDFQAPYENEDKYKSIPGYAPRNGRYSTVYTVRNRETEEKCALKVFHSRTRNSQIAREISILQQIHNGPNLISLLALLVNSETTKRTLVLEYIKNDNFRQLYPKFSASDNKFYFFQLFKGIEFLHRKGIMHRNIRARNILIDHESHRLRLIDFSVATVYKTEGTHSTKVIPPAMKSPELLAGLIKYDFAVDMWAVGLLMILAIFRAPCFPACRHDRNQLVQITSLLGTDELFTYLSRYNMELSPELVDILSVYHHPPREFSSFVNPENQHLVPYEALDILNLIVCYDHKRRLSATQALQHKYFDDVRIQ